MRLIIKTGGTKMRTWFAVENSLVDRNDLTAYEKLCGMVLARYAGRPEFDHLLTTDIIAVKMGVSSELALEALRGLVRKGLIDTESASDLFVEGSENHIRNIELEEFQEPEASAIIRSEVEELEAEPLQFAELEETTEDILGDDFDNLDKLIEQAKTMAESTVDRSFKDAFVEPEPSHDIFSERPGERFDMEPNQVVNQHRPLNDMEQATPQVSKPTPYNRGLASYQNAKSIPTPTPQSEPMVEESADLDPELLNKQIHEQSDSVRAWIEESESAAPLIPKVPATNKEQLVEDVLEMIEEPINDRQARIILGLAEYDLERVRKCYLVAQNTQVTDKIDMLIHELQKREEAQTPKRVPRTSQVDHVRLDQMKKYQAMKNNK